MKKLLTNWKFLVAVVVVGLFAWQYLSGFSSSRALFKQIMAGLVEDKTEIVETLEEAVENYEKQIDAYLKDINKLREANKRQEAIIDGLKKKLENIVVSNDPDTLIRDLEKRGIGPIRKRRILR